MSAKKYFYSASVLAFVLPMASVAKTKSDVNVCYTEFREEMVTASLYTAKKEKLFTQNGVNVRWTQGEAFGKPPIEKVMKESNLNPSAPTPYYINNVNEVALLQAADQKKCDFISTTFEAVLGSKLNLNEYVPVAVYQYGKNYDTHLVVRSNSDIKSVKDLKGKTIRYNQIGSILPFENLLKKAGMKLEDVKLERSTLVSLVDDLDDKKIDAVLSYNPTIPLLLGSGRVRILEKNLFENFYKEAVPHSLLLVKKEFMTKNQALYANFMKSFQKASDEMVKKPENIVNAVPDIKAKYSAPEIEKSLAFIQVGNPMLATNKSPKEFFAGARFDEYAGVLKDHGFIKNPVDLSAWVY